MFCGRKKTQHIQKINNVNVCSSEQGDAGTLYLIVQDNYISYCVFLGPGRCFVELSVVAQHLCAVSNTMDSDCPVGRLCVEESRRVATTTSECSQ